MGPKVWIVWFSCVGVVERGFGRKPTFWHHHISEIIYLKLTMGSEIELDWEVINEMTDIIALHMYSIVIRLREMASSMFILPSLFSVIWNGIKWCVMVCRIEEKLVNGAHKCGKWRIITTFKEMDVPKSRRTRCVPLCAVVCDVLNTHMMSHIYDTHCYMC